MHKTSASINEFMVAKLYEDENITFTLNYFGDEVRVCVWDSDNKWLDDWAFDVGENINQILVWIEEYKIRGFDSWVEDCMNYHRMLRHASVQQWIDSIKKYGEDYVRRIGDTIIVTDGMN